MTGVWYNADRTYLVYYASNVDRTYLVSYVSSADRTC